jgi:hypothetical protein
MSNAPSENVFPDVTDCDADNDPTASSRVFVLSVIAHFAAVPDPVTDPSVIAALVTLRPFGEPAAGEPNTAPAPQFLFPSAYVDVASV